MVDVTLGTPRSQVAARPPIEVWREGPEPGQWEELSDRLDPGSLFVGSDETIDKLDIHYAFGEGRFPVVGNTGAFQSDYLARAVADVSPNRRIRVFASHPDDDGSICLFDGFPELSTVSWGSNPQQHDQGVRFECRSVLTRWQDDVRSQVIGRYVHGGFAAPDPPPGEPTLYNEENLRLIESQPCLFNEDGEGNCSPHPIKVFFDVPDRGQSIEVPLYVFAPRHVRREGQANQQEGVRYWTFARAFVYLLYFYAQKPWLDIGQQPPIAVTGDLIDRLLEGELLDQEPMANPLNISDLFNRAMLTQLDDLATDRTSLREALLLLGREGDVHFNAAYTTNSAPDDVTTSLRVWVGGHGYWEGANQADFALSRWPPRRRMPNNEFLRLVFNRAMQAGITYDYTDLVNAPIVVGGTTLYEVTVELVPAWLPLTNLDNVDVEDAEAVKVAKEFWQPLGPTSGLDAGALAKYLKSHQDHPEVADIGRKWALNESGRYPAEDADEELLYARDVEPFEKAQYDTFDFSTIPIVDYYFSGDELDLAEDAFPTFAMRPRPFRDPLTKLAGGETGPYVEVSFDSGTTWHHVNGVQISPTEAGVTFSVESPLEITPPNTNWWDQNMWYAIIDGTFRVRVTAAVAGDRLMIPRRGDDARHGLTSIVERTKARVFDKPDGPYELRTEMDSALSQKEIVAAHDEQMDMEKAERFRSSLGRAYADRKIAMSPVTPWMDLGVRIGMRITNAGGTGLSTEMRTGDETMYPTVVGLIYELGEVQQTSILVSDFRHVAEEVSSV